MIQSELQQCAHAGDREAFREIYETYSREVYALAQRRFNDAEKSRGIVRQVFLSLYRELLHEDEDIDIPARVSAIADEEIRIRRIADGDLSEDTLKAQCALAEEPDTSGTMERIRRRMDAEQERDAGEAGSEEPAVQPAVPTETMQGTVPQARAKDAAQPELLQTPKKKKRARCASISTSSSSGCSKPKKASMPRKCASCNPSAPCHSASSSHASPPTAKARKPTTTARWRWATTCSSRAQPPWAP